MSQLLLLTNALAPSAEVLPALGLLGHAVRVLPAEPAALVDAPPADFVLVDDGREPLRALPAVLAFAVLGAFTHQMLRRDLRPRVVDGLGGSTTGLLLAALGSGWVAAASVGAAPVVSAAAATAAAALATALPGSRALGGGVGLVSGGAAGALGAVAAGGGALAGAQVGLAAGAVVVLVAVLLAPLAPASRRLPALGRGATPVAAAGAVAGLLAPLLLP